MRQKFNLTARFTTLFLTVNDFTLKRLVQMIDQLHADFGKPLRRDIDACTACANFDRPNNQRLRSDTSNFNWRRDVNGGSQNAPNRIPLNTKVDRCRKRLAELSAVIQMLSVRYRHVFSLTYFQCPRNRS